MLVVNVAHVVDVCNGVCVVSDANVANAVDFVNVANVAIVAS